MADSVIKGEKSVKIVTLECPNCGARIERDRNGYFGNCPFCGTEVCFDEIKGEAQAGQINDLKDRVEAYQERERYDEEGRFRIRRWIKWRNISYAGFFVFSFLGFSLVGLSNSRYPEDDTLVGFGAVFFIMLITLFFAAPPALAAHYPDYDLINDKVSLVSRLGMWGRLAITSAGIALIAAFTVYLILRSMGRA